MPKRRTVVLLAIVVLALILRLAAICEYGPSAIRFGDAPDYLSAAASLCTTGVYPDRSSMPFFRAPGLPFFIVAATLCHPNMAWLVKVALAGIDSASAVIVFLLAEELLRHRRASMLAACAAACYPFFIGQVCDIQTEALFMFLFLTAIWLTLKAIRIHTGRLMLLAGVCAGAAALVRPAGLLLLPFLAATPAFLRNGTGSKQYARCLTSFALGAAISLAPWIVRNEIRFHELILVNDAAGYNFWRGTSAAMARIDRLTDPRAFAEASVQFETVTSPVIARQIDAVAATPSGRSRQWFGRAIETFEQDPAAFLSRLAWNAFAYWRPWLNPQTHSTAVVAATGLMTTSLYLLALAGWNLLRKREARLALWCAAGAALFWLSQIPFQAVSRFRIPIADPFLIILAAASLATVFKRPTA